MKPKRKPFSPGGSLYIVQYEDGRTASCANPANSLNALRSGSLASAYTFVTEGQS